MKGICNNIRKGDVSSEWGKAFQELKEAGGKTGFFDSKTINKKGEERKADRLGECICSDCPYKNLKNRKMCKS